MRDNYFEIKLESTKDRLAWTIQELESTNNQIIREQAFFDEKIRLCNEKIKRLDDIQAKAVKDIKHYEDMIKRGYKFIDMRNGKAYKTERNLQKQLLSEKSPAVDPPEDGEVSREAKELEIEIENRKAEKVRLKAERKAQKAAEEAERIRKKEEERLRIEAEKLLKEQKEQELKEAEEMVQLEEEMRLKKEADRLEKERLEQLAKIEELKKKREEEQKRLEEARKEEERTAEVARAKAEEVAKAIDNHVDAGIEVDKIEKEITKEEKDLIWIETSTQGQALAAKYQQNEGGHAIWQGVVTKGFRRWCEENSLRIGE